MEPKWLKPEGEAKPSSELEVWTKVKQLIDTYDRTNSPEDKGNAMRVGQRDNFPKCVEYLRRTNKVQGFVLDIYMFKYRGLFALT